MFATVRLSNLPVAVRRLIELPAAIGRYLDRREELHWQPRQLTLRIPLPLLGAAERKALRDELEHFSRGSATTQGDPVPGLLAARGALIETAPLEVDGRCTRPASLELVLELVHVGDAEDLVAELFERRGPTLHALLEQCENYPGPADVPACSEWLLAAQQADVLLEARPDPEPAPTDEALDYGFSLMAPFERAVPDENLWVRRAADLHAAGVRRATREARRKNPLAIAVRGAHAKQHGLLRGKLVVRADLPVELQHGVFMPSAEHHAWLRLSNMTDRIQRDHQFDARGLAIKLVHVAGYGRRFETGLADAAAVSDTVEQDFNLASPETFFVKDVRDYSIVRSIFNLHDKQRLLRQLLRFGLRRPRETFTFVRSLLVRPAHPLAIPYYSISAYALGSAQAVKYCVRPLSKIEADESLKSDDYLRERLRRSLDPKTGGPIQLEFCMIVPKAWARLSVEDARSNWLRFGRARCIQVATLEFAPQDPCSEERMRLAEQLVFTPWTTLEAHRPLGNLTRARLSVYRASSDHRRATNAKLRTAAVPEAQSATQMASAH